MRRTTTPGPVKGQEPLSKLGGIDDTPNKAIFTHPLTGKNRLMILEELAEKWANRGYFPSPIRAMAALLGVTE